MADERKSNVVEGEAVGAADEPLLLEDAFMVRDNQEEDDCEKARNLVG